MIVAKGGRDRLNSIRSILIIEQYRWRQFLSTSTLDYRHLYVFPDFNWRWSDYGSKLFGIEVSSTDYASGLRLTLRPGTATPRREVVGDRRDDAYVAMFLLQTKWLKPSPRRCEIRGVGADQIAVVDVEIPGSTVNPRYFVSMDTRLPTRVDRMVNGSPLVALLSEYSSIDGLMLPAQHETHGAMDKRLPLSVKYEINPDYDPEFLKRPPSVQNGPEAWRLKQNRRNRRSR